MKPTDILTDLVRGIVGKRAEAMGDADLKMLVDEFVSAGRAAVLGKAGSPAKAAEALRTASRLQRIGADRIASSTRPGYRDCITDSGWRLYQKTLDVHRDDLLALPNVVGHAVGTRWKSMGPTEERRIVVLVRRKKTPDALEASRERMVPKELSVSGRQKVKTDVIEVGDFEPFVGSGHCVEALGFGTDDWGTIGLIARDNRTDAPVALTALHVVPDLEEYPPAGRRAAEVQFASPCTPAGQNPDPTYRLGKLTRGTRKGIDAARIDIDPSRSVSDGVPGIGAVRGWRPLDREGDAGTPVQMFGARSGRVRYGRIVLPSASLPEQGIENAIVADIPSQGGDSGAALLDLDGFVLGLLIGGDPSSDRRWFSPISTVMKTLDCYL